MKVRRMVPIAAVLVLALCAVLVALVSSAGAQAPELPSELSDQQDVALNASGQATVRFDHGDPVLGAGWDTCMVDTPIVTVQLAATLTAGKPQPRTWSARFNNPCSFLVTVFDASNRPISNATVRLGYIAIIKGALIDTTPPAGAVQRQARTRG